MAISPPATASAMPEKRYRGRPATSSAAPVAGKLFLQLNHPMGASTTRCAPAPHAAPVRAPGTRADEHGSEVGLDSGRDGRYRGQRIPETRRMPCHSPRTKPVSFRLEQPATGYRFTVASLVPAAHTASLGEARRLLEVGSGVGVVSLLLASVGAAASIEGIEIQEALHGLSLVNTAAHARFLRVPVTFTRGNVRQWQQHWPAGCFDRVISNPPFCTAGLTRAHHRN